MSGPRRVEELLAERATQGLATAEAGELEVLLAASPEIDADGFDIAATALNLAMLDELEPMPRRLRRVVLDRARDELEAPTADARCRSASSAFGSRSSRAWIVPTPCSATVWAPCLHSNSCANCADEASRYPPCSSPPRCRRRSFLPSALPS